MRTITTSRDKTYAVDYAWAPTYDGSCMIQMRDGRRLPKIVAEFDGLEQIHYVDTDLDSHDFVGYTRLVTVTRLEGDTVQLRLVREQDAKEE